ATVASAFSMTTRAVTADVETLPQASGSTAIEIPPLETASPVVPPSATATLPPAPGIKAQVGLSAPPSEVSPAATVAPTVSPTPVADVPLTGRIGGYELIHELGHGGMGSVYLARQISLDRNVALKILAPSLAGDPQFVSRFTREAYAAAQLSHHNIVQIHDI